MYTQIIALLYRFAYESTTMYVFTYKPWWSGDKQFQADTLHQPAALYVPLRLRTGHFLKGVSGFYKVRRIF